ncbi:glycerophosphoryl diester phosphodiesterase membrane domain-containing protein [Microbacterium sp. JZ101]
MTAEPSWTPAPRGGLIPLQPLGFGTILGRSFSALRGNPRVLLGFAMVVQLAASIVGVVVIGWVTYAAMSRLDTVNEFSDDFGLIAAGSTLIAVLTTIGVALVMSVLGIIVQAVVVGEVAHAALGERATLGAIWRRVRPVVWRLIGYYALVTIAVSVAVGVLIAVGFALGSVEIWMAVVYGVLAALAAIVLYAWLGTKLFVVPSAIILEHATVIGGIRRSWQLTRGRFWPTFGIIVLIGLIMNTASYVVGMPFTFLGSAMSSIFAPTGSPDAAAGIGFVLAIAASQIVTLVISSVTVVVQATSSALVYIDARMRREGIDLRMQSYVERRDSGRTDLDDPYAFDPDAVAPVRASWPAYAGPAYGSPAAPYGAQPPYGQPAPQYGQYAPQYGQPAPQYGQPTPQYGQPAPQYGQYAHQYGQPAPQYGQPAPQYGQYAPTSGQPAPSERTPDASGAPASAERPTAPPYARPVDTGSAPDAGRTDAADGS